MKERNILSLSVE